MATFTDTIRILIQADGAKASSELERVGKTAQREMDRADKSTRNWSATFTRAGVGLTTFAAVAGAGLYRAAQAADEAQQAQLRLDNTIANSPRLTEQSARAFRDLAAALMAKTVVDDDAIVSSQALLGQFGLTEQQILSLTPLVVDLSRKMGVDLDTASKAVAKAVNGSGTALNRMGIQVKAGADGVVDFTDVMGALSSKVGGFAEQEAKTFTGQIEQMKNQLGEVAENIGGGVIPVFKGMLAPIKAVSEGFAALPAGAQSTIGSVLGIGVAASGAMGAVALLAGKLETLKTLALVDPTAGLSGGLTGAGKAMGIAAGAAGVLGIAYTLLAGDTDDATRASNELTDAVKNTGKTLEDVAGQKLAEWVAANRDVVDAAAMAGVSVQDLSRAVLGGDDAYAAVVGKIEDYQRALGDTSDTERTAYKLREDLEQQTGQNYVEAQQNLGRLTATLNENRDAYRQSRADIKATNDAQSDIAGTYRGSTRAAKALGDATSEAGRKTRVATDGLLLWKQYVEANEDALSSLIGEIDRYQDRLRGTRDSTRDAALAQLDAADAVQQVADAQKAYNDTVGEFGAGSAEAAGAQRELQRAVIGAYQAQDDATQAVLENAAAQAGYERGTRNSIEQTRRYVRELANARNEVDGPTRDALNKHIARLLDVPEERATTMTLPQIRERMRDLENHRDKVLEIPLERITEIKAGGTSAASAAVQRVRDQIDGLQDKNVTVTVTAIIDAAAGSVINFLNSFGFNFPGAATGGPIPAGRATLVGERGPELFVENTSKRTRVIGADGPEVIKPDRAGFVIPNDRLRDARGGTVGRGEFDNVTLDAQFIHNGPVDASTTAVLYGNDQALLDKGAQGRKGLLGRLAGRRAAGGPVEGGQAYLVGESGPELVVPQSDSNVVAAGRLRQLGYRMPQVPARGGDVIVVNFHGPVASQRQAEDWVVSALASARRRGNRLAS